MHRQSRSAISFLLVLLFFIIISLSLPPLFSLSLSLSPDFNVATLGLFMYLWIVCLFILILFFNVWSWYEDNKKERKAVGFMHENRVKENEGEKMDSSCNHHQRHHHHHRRHHRHLPEEEEAGDDIQFWPIQHPMEPSYQDNPVKCPLPDSSSVLNVSLPFITFALIYLSLYCKFFHIL